MKYSKSAIGLLTREYRSVLKKCLLINLGLFALGAATLATPAKAVVISGNTNLNGDYSSGVISETGENAKGIDSTSVNGYTTTFTTPTINITANGTNGRGVDAWWGSNVTLGGEDTTSVSVTGTQRGLSIFDPDTVVNVNSTGSVALTGGESGAAVVDRSKLNMTAQDITVTSSDGNGISAETGRDGNGHYIPNSGGKINIDTDNLTVTAKNSGVAASYSKSQIDINATGDVNIKATGDDSYARAVNVGNSSTDDNITKENTSYVSIKAKNINLTSNTDSGGIGISAMSNGIVELEGNTTIVAQNAIDTRGKAITNINASGNNTVKIDGDIVFDYYNNPGNPGNSGSLVDATVNINLTNSDSYWTGNSYVDWYDGTGTAKPTEDKLRVTGFNASLSDGATWNAEKVTESGVDTNEGKRYTALNNLNVDGGNVNFSEAGAQVEIDNLKVGESGVNITKNADSDMMKVNTSADFRNGVADNHSSDINVANDASIYVDADSAGNLIDDVAGDKSQIKLEGIQLASANVTGGKINTAGYNVTSNAKNSLKAYYQTADTDSAGNIVLGAKQAYTDLIGILQNGNYIKAYDAANADTTSVAANLKALDDQVFANAGDIATNAENIAANTANISTNTANIATNAENIADNAAAIAGKADLTNTNQTITAGTYNVANKWTMYDAADSLVQKSIDGKSKSTLSKNGELDLFYDEKVYFSAKNGSILGKKDNNTYFNASENELILSKSNGGTMKEYFKAGDGSLKLSKAGSEYLNATDTGLRLSNADGKTYFSLVNTDNVKGLNLNKADGSKTMFSVNSETGNVISEGKIEAKGNVQAAGLTFDNASIANGFAKVDGETTEIKLASQGYVDNGLATKSLKINGTVEDEEFVADGTATVKDGDVEATFYTKAKADDLLAAKFDKADVIAKNANTAATDTNVYSALKTNAVVADTIADSTLMANADKYMYGEVKTAENANKAVSAGALTQLVDEVGKNMKADQLGWDINVKPSDANSFSQKLGKSEAVDLYDSLTGTNRTVIGALNKAGDAIGDMNFTSAKIEGVKNATDLSTAVRALDTQAKNIADNAVFYTDISTAELPNRKAIVLKNHDIILGTDKDGNTYNLAMLSKWDVADFGSNKIHMNLNSKDGVATLNDDQVVLTDQLLNKVVAADGNIVMTPSDVTADEDGIAHKKYTFSTKPNLNATSLTLTSTETANAALTMNGTSVNSIDQVEGAAAGNNVLASKATVNKAVADSILMANASPNIYKDVMAEDKYAEKAVSAGALKQIALQVGTNMQADQLGWNINVDPTKGGSFAKSLTSTFYNGLENKTVIGALNKAGDEIAANTARFEDVLNPDTQKPTGEKYTVVQSIQKALNNPKQDIVADDVHANTIEADTSLKVGTSTPVTGTSGTDAAAIKLDDNDMPYVADGSEAILATTASLNQAVNNVLTFAGQTFNAKQQWLDGFTGISSSDEKGQQHAFETSFAGTYNILEDKDGVKTTNMNLAKAFKNIDSNMGKIHGLVGEDGAVASSDAQKIVSTTGTHSNLAKGTSVEMHLVSLDNTIGDRSKISNEKGSNSYALTARTNVADVLSDIASQIGKAGDLTSTINGVALTNTVNTNISAVNSKLGDVSTLYKAKIDAVKTSTNAVDAILALDTALQVNPEGWRAINALTIDGKSKGDNTRTAQTLGDAIFNLGMNIDRINENKFLSVANDGKTATMYDKQFEGDKNKAEFYTTAGANEKFLGKTDQLDGQYLKPASVTEGALAEAVTAKLNKANTALQSADLGSEFVMAEGKVAVNEIAQSKITGLADDLAKKANVADYKIKTASDEFTVADGQLSVNSIAASKISGLADVAKSGNFADLTVGKGAIKRAMIADGAINRKKLAQAIKDSLDLADTAVQEEDLADVAFSGKYADLKVADGAIKRAKLGEGVQKSLAKADTAVQNGDASLTLGTGAGAEELTADKIAQISTNAGLLAGMGEGQTVVSYVSANAVNGKYNPNGTYATDSIGAALQGKADADSVISNNKIVQTIAATADAKEDNVASEKAIAQALDRKVNTADVLNSVTAEPADGKIYDAKTVNSELAKKFNTSDIVTTVAASDTASDTKVASEKAIRTALDKKLDAATLDAYKVKDVDDDGTILLNRETGKIKVGTIGLNNISDDAFGAIQANGTKLVNSGTIYTYFQDYAKLGAAANFSSLTLGTAAAGETLQQATAISNGAKVAAINGTDYQTLATNATVRNTVDDAVSSAISGILADDNTWKGENTFEKETTFNAGIDVTAGDVEVDNGDIIVNKGDVVVTDGTVKTGSLTLNGNEVTQVNTGVKSDGSADVVTGNGSGSVLATTATVMASAENAKFTADDNPAASLNGATTINQAINNVASAVDKNTQGIADLNNLVGTLGTITADYAKTIDATTGNKSDPANIATAIQNVATAAAKADGTLNFNQKFTTSDGKAVADDGSNKATNLTDAINNVAKNAEAAIAGVSADIHGDGTAGSTVEIGDKADKTTIGKVNSDTGLTGIEVDTANKTVDLAVNKNGSGSNIAMDTDSIAMSVNKDGKSVGIEIANDEGRTIELGEPEGYAMEINVDNKTTTIGSGDGKEVVIGEGTVLADKSVMVGDPAGKVTAMYDTGIVAKENDNNQSTLGSTGLWVKKGSDEAGVSGTGMWASDGTKTANVSKTGLWVGEGTNSVSVGSTGVYVTDGTDHSHMGPAGIYTTKDVTAAGYVSGKEVVANEGFTLAGTRVTAIDTGATPVTGNGSAETLATTATVMASAENAKFSSEDMTGVTQGTETLHDAIEALDSAMGTMVLNTGNKNLVDDSGATLTNATDALNALDGVVGNVKDLNVSKGNLHASNKDVASHLSALDARLGTIKAIDGGANGNLAGDDSDVATHFNSLDVAMGNRTNYKNNSGSNGYVAVNDGTKDLTTMISEVASNIGKADDISSTNQISARQTVNANLSSLDAAIGNVDALSEELGATDLTSAINNLNTKVNESNGAFSKAINKLDMDQRKLRHDFEAGMAGQAALSALVPNAKASGNTQLAVGTGAYKGHTAAAVGGFHWFTDNLLFNAGVAWDNNEATGRMGITYSW